MCSQPLLLLHSGCSLSPVPCSLCPIFTLGSVALIIEFVAVVFSRAQQ
jgi:hypothetical protein